MIRLEMSNKNGKAITDKAFKFVIFNLEKKIVKKLTEIDFIEIRVNVCRHGMVNIFFGNSKNIHIN